MDHSPPSGVPMSIFDFVTPQRLRQTYLGGIDLTTDQGSPFSDFLLTDAIKQAVSSLEMELGIVIDPLRVVGERHDANIKDRESFWPWHLNHRPVVNITEVKLQIGNNPFMVMPLSWFNVNEPEAGIVNLVPTSESIGSYFFRSGMPLVFGDIFNPYVNVPGYWGVDYIAGFRFEDGIATIKAGETSVDVTIPGATLSTKPIVECEFTGASNGALNPKMKIAGTKVFTIGVSQAPTQDTQITWKLTTVEPALIKAISLMASILPLGVSGNLVFGAGISNFSLGVDGLSQSISTTKSGDAGAYNALIKQYQAELAQVIPQLKAKYRAMNIAII